MSIGFVTLNINNYEPEICRYTYPSFEQYADKIGADFIEITKRKFPGYPIPYEKFQIYELSFNYEWIIYFDADTMLHPDLFDITSVVTKDTIVCNKPDIAALRFEPDEYFRRDGRNIGMGNWFTVSSNWCRDRWKPLDDLTQDEAISRIHPIAAERQLGITADHLLDDYVASRNIARYGLKYKSLNSLIEEISQGQLTLGTFLYHEYLLSSEQKRENIKRIYRRWFEPEVEAALIEIAKANNRA